VGQRTTWIPRAAINPAATTGNALGTNQHRLNQPATNAPNEARRACDLRSPTATAPTVSPSLTPDSGGFNSGYPGSGHEELCTRPTRLSTNTGTAVDEGSDCDLSGHWRSTTTVHRLCIPQFMDQRRYLMMLAAFPKNKKKPPHRHADGVEASRTGWFAAFLADRGTGSPSAPPIKAYPPGLRRDRDLIAEVLSVRCAGRAITATPPPTAFATCKCEIP